MASSPKKLSANEVAALVGDLMDMDNGGDGDVEVRAYVFGQNDTTVLADYYALQMVNERFCRLARNVFLPMLRMQPRVSSFPPELRSFEDYRSSQDNFVSITNSRIEELRGNKLIVIPPSFISLLTDAYYGGAIKPMKQTRTEFTASEGRVIEIVANRLNEALQLAWRDLVPLNFAIASHEENMQFAQFVDGEDMVVICTFMVQIPGSDPASFDLIYPLQTLKPISSQLRSRMQSDFVDDDHTWRDRLERAILEVPLSVSARLSEPEISLQKLLQLRSGDVIPTQLTDVIEVLIEGQHLFNAQAGNLGGQSALRVLGRTTQLPDPQ
jgi:flagellar motor switch protein FliM